MAGTSSAGYCRGQKTNIAVNRCDPNALRKDLHTVKLSERRNSLPTPCAGNSNSLPTPPRACRDRRTNV